jgi:hypothetical protein
MRALRATLAFLYDFLVGDDLVLFAIAAAAVALTAIVAGAGVNVWWLVPLAVALGLAASVRRAARRGPPAP